MIINAKQIRELTNEAQLRIKKEEDEKNKQLDDEQYSIVQKLIFDEANYGNFSVVIYQNMYTVRDNVAAKLRNKGFHVQFGDCVCKISW